MPNDDEKGHEPQDVTIETTVMPSLGDQMDEYGTGDLGLRKPIASFDDPETGEHLGEVLIDMAGRLWVEFEDGPRVTFDPGSVAESALAAVEASEYSLEVLHDDA